MRTATILLCLAAMATGCAKNSDSPQAGASTPTPLVVGAPEAAPSADAAAPSEIAPASSGPVEAEPGPALLGGEAAGADPASADPAELYAMCRERVEGRQKAGECEADADCVKGGCSGEVCVPKELAPTLMTTCEVRPCFAALDTCGCHDGQCTWSLKEGPINPLPGGGHPLQLPPQ